MPQRTKDRLAEARALDMNMSRVAIEAIAKAVTAERWGIWKEKYMLAFEAYNE